MDRPALSEALVEELGELFVGELRRVGPALVASDLDGIEHQLQEVSRRVLGRVVEAVVTVPSARGIAVGQAGERPTCGPGQQRMRRVDAGRVRALQGLVGAARVRTPHGHGDRAGRAHARAAARVRRVRDGRAVLVPGLRGGLPGVAVVAIVDLFHAWGHRWKVANAVFGAGTAQATGGAEPLKGRLLDEGPAPILTALTELAPTVVGTDAAEEVRKARDYFTEHADRMDSPRFVARQLPIGSGAIERTCKTLIQAREKQAGLRWSHDGAQTVAFLRALQRSGRWSHCWQAHPQRRRPPIAPPRPTTSATPASVPRAA